jgi:hypothetical protein
MSTLGAILARMDDPAAIAALIAEAGSLGLLARLGEAAASARREPIDIACDAVARFTQSADSEAWVKLMGRMQGEASAAAACLAEMVEWALNPPAKACGHETLHVER